MSDELDDRVDETPEEVLEWLTRELKTKGVRTAYKTAIAVCEDPKAPAPAKATMVTALMRAAGLFARTGESSELEIHAMSSEQIAAELARMRRESRRLAKPLADEDDDEPAGDGGVFT